VDNRGRPLLENYSDVGVRADASDIDPGNGLVTALLNAGPDTFGLSLKQGLFNARVQAQLSTQNGGADFLTQLNSLLLKMQFHTAIMTNAWTGEWPGNRGRHVPTGQKHGRRPCLTGWPVPASYKVADAAYLPAFRGRPASGWCP